jgi:hypothetical protein
MTAIACLRILFTADGDSQPGDIPKHKAQGVADAFLKARWRSPRKCGAVAPLAFVVADHHVEQLDPGEVQGLAAELEKVLFPGRPIGQIALMSFEGDEQAVLQFASLPQKDLKGLLDGEGYGGAPGRVHVITADSIEPLPATRTEAKVQAKVQAKEKAAEKKSGLATATTVVKEAAPAAPAAAPVVPVVEPPKAETPVQEGPPIVTPAPGKAKSQQTLAARLTAKVEAPPPPPPPAETGWWGIYDLVEGVFVGSAIGMRADLVEPPPEDDSKLLKRDLIALTDAQAALKTAAFGEIHVPFGFWNLTTPASQEAYKTRLSRYPLDKQPRLVATVYGTPREASIGMLQQARAFLQGSFAQMDVRITDPTFPISGLPPELVDTITLVLDGETDHDRLKQILKFVERKAQYVAKGVRQVVANVTSDVELEACKAGGITRVQGPAVTDLLDKPVASAEGAPVALARNAA